MTDRPLRTVEVIARPDARKSLSDGVVVKASLIGRVLGLKLLRINADVILLPAEAAPVRRIEPVYRPPLDGDGGMGGLGDAAGLLAHAAKTIRETRHYRI